jgi:hypothetical protein
VDVSEDHRFRAYPEAVDDPGQGGNARAPHLKPEQRRIEGSDAVAEEAARNARHRSGAQQLGRVLGQGRQRPRQPAGEQRLHPRERGAAGLLVLDRRGVVAGDAA